MKIVALHIYGYGQLENVNLDHLADFQVFFGENEAGKSTIMAFINGILFGFPTKQQSSELRYEPKHSSKYGGKIRIYHEELGFAVIERVKGKAAGDVHVVLDNGTIGGEELLKELLANFDKGLFQAVFSFNLHGLQNIHQMRGEDLGKFLFSAGALGTESLSKTEAELRKELDSRFKPSGRKPILNDQLQKVHEIYQELKKAAAKNKEYENLIAQSEGHQQEMSDINVLLAKIQEKVEKLIEWKRIESLVKDEKWIKKELEELGDVEFPVRGIERLERLNQLILPYNAELNSLTERIEKVKKELAAIEPDHSLLEKEAAILSLLDQVPLYEQLRLEKQQCETKLLDFEERLSIIKERLHLPLNEEGVLSINTNIYMKKQVEICARNTQKLVEVKEQLEERYQEGNNSLKEIASEALVTERMCLSKQERVTLEERIQGNSKKRSEDELRNVQEKIEFYQDSIEQDKVRRKRLRLQFFVFEILLVGLVFYGILTEQSTLLVLGFAGCAIVAVFMTQSLKQIKGNKAAETLAGLREREKQLLQNLHSADSFEVAKFEEQLKLDNQRLARLQSLQINLKQQQSQLEKLNAKFGEWELQSAENKEKLLSLSSELKIPEYMADVFLLEAFQQIEQYKSFCREKNQLLNRAAQITRQQAEIVGKFTLFENRHLSEKGADLHKTAFLLRNRLKEEQEKLIRSRERQVRLAGLAAEWQQKSDQLGQLNAEYLKLIRNANVETEQQFYLLGEKAEKREKRLERLETIKSQLQYSILPEQLRESFLHLHNGDELAAEYNEEARKLQSQLKKKQEEHAAIKYEIQILEEGGVYSDILHHFQQKKFELEEAAKEWAVFSLAQNILSETIERYKNDHLPRMLSTAEEFLSFLTNESYQRIHPHPLGTGFLVERKDHTLFEANELSQATTEQLYVSIRLALATTLYEKYQLPIIIDDSFVNFDSGRTEKVIELLHRLDRNQILFFTCHRHILPLFPKENILSLAKGAVQIIS